MPLELEAPESGLRGGIFTVQVFRHANGAIKLMAMPKWACR
jgi:hypothetical protein